MVGSRQFPSDCPPNDLVITGTVNVSGLSIRGLVTYVTINDATWTALPPTALTQRNAIRIQNRSGVQVVTNYDNSDIGIPLPATYQGMELQNNGDTYYDIRNTIKIYAKAAPGSGSVILRVEEIA